MTLISDTVVEHLKRHAPTLIKLVELGGGAERDETGSTAAWDC